MFEERLIAISPAQYPVFAWCDVTSMIKVFVITVKYWYFAEELGY